MEVVQSLSELKSSESQWGEGYYDFVVSKGKVVDDRVVLDLPALHTIRARYPAPLSKVFSLALLKAAAPYQPPGYVEFVLANCRIEGDNVYLEPIVRKELIRRFPLATRAVTYRVADLRNNSLLLPEQYLKMLFIHGKIVGEFLILDNEAKKKFAFIYNRQQARVKLNIPKLKENAFKRPPGHLERVLAKGKVEGDSVTLDLATAGQIDREFPLLITFSVKKLKEESSRHPKGFVEYVLAHGRIEGEHVIFDVAAGHELKGKFPEFYLPSPPEPSMTQLAANFSGAMVGWAKAGFKTVAREVYEKRSNTCLACPHWDAKAMAGLGKCRICGCSKMKLWLATSKCPDKPSRW